MKSKVTKLNKNFYCLIAVFIFSFLFFNFNTVQAATISLSPSAGTFETDSTFDVSVFLNTEGETVNAIEISLSFPADKLQLVSPSAGQSIIGIWTAPPNFDNQNGRISLKGGIPGGINADKGLITKFTFRAKSVGASTIRFLDNSRVLLHDGKGTDVLRNTVNGVYFLILPPPAGPIVSSVTHPDPSAWYTNPNIALRWTAESGSADGYSYLFNQESFDRPDEISEGDKESVIYQNTGDGLYYFHIKTLKDGQWGGTTHFIVQVDNNPPAEFPVEIIPSERTTRRQPIVQFATTDPYSGLDHYELKIVPLQSQVEVEAASQPLFIEVQSPYVLPELSVGTYDIIVRAYDKAGSYRESTKHLVIVNAVFKIVSGKGIEMGSRFVIPWLWFWAFGLLLVSFLIVFGRRVRRWHYSVHEKQSQKELPEYIKKQLEELRNYRKRYGSKAPLVLLLFLVGSLLLGHNAFAENQGLEPPIITTVSQSVSNEEIFYVGGKTVAPQIEIVLYLQSIQSGETTSYHFSSDNKGDWFYRHDRFLPAGRYILWAQSRMVDELSPPTPQSQITVYPIALQFGASRLSYTMVYLILIIILLAILAGLISYISFHSRHGRRKHALLMKEIKEAEESVRRGFAVLRRDIHAELAAVSRAKATGQFSEEEKKTTAQLLRDLAKVERYIGKEVWDVEKADYNG